MTLTIDLPDEQTAALTAKAQAHGVTAEEYARRYAALRAKMKWGQRE